MKYIAFTIFFIITFSISEENYNKNWDDDFIDNFFLCALNSDVCLPNIYNLLNNCISNPKNYSSIDNMCDAIRHYKANSGNTVTANSNLINHIKKQFNFLNPKSYTYVKANIAEIIQTKIKLERLNGKKKAIIKSEPNSTRSIWYLTLGSFTVNI